MILFLIYTIYLLNPSHALSHVTTHFNAQSCTITHNHAHFVDPVHAPFMHHPCTGHAPFMHPSCTVHALVHARPKIKFDVLSATMTKKEIIPRHLLTSVFGTSNLEPCNGSILAYLWHINSHSSPYLPFNVDSK